MSSPNRTVKSSVGDFGKSSTEDLSSKNKSSILLGEPPGQLTNETTPFWQWLDVLHSGLSNCTPVSIDQLYSSPVWPIVLQSSYSF